MNKIKWWVVLPLLVFLGLLAFLHIRQADPENEFVIPDHILICLDPGHGGDDPGAVLGDRQEKDDNLRMALAVRDKLESYGFENLSVMLTREEDTALELQQRVEIANDARATLFISIHRNSGGGQGVETWVSAEGHRHELQLAASIQDKLDKAGIAYEKRLASQYPAQVEEFGIRQAPTLVVAKGGNAHGQTKLYPFLPRRERRSAKGALFYNRNLRKIKKYDIIEGKSKMT